MRAPKQLCSVIFAILFVVASVDALARPAELTAQKIEQLLKVEPVIYQQGPLQGLAVDQDSKRPVTLVKELETSSSMFVTHVYNQGKFWVAEIPKSKVKKVIMQLALFPGPLDYLLAHAQYRFQLDSPARLYRVRDGRVVSTKSGDFIFTIQAAMPKGMSYSAKDALLGSYKIVGRLVNTYDRAQLEEVAGGDIVTQYELKKMSAHQMNLLLQNALTYSSRVQLTRDYKLINENCISIAFDLLDSAIGSNKPRVTLTIENLLQNGKSPNEKMALDALVDRGLIDSTSRLPDYKNY